jgi:hypothetical protein
LPVALLLFLACAAGRGSTGAAPESEHAITVTVRNNLTPRTLVTVRVFSRSGVRTFLGSVPPAQTKSFTFDEPMFEAAYQLVAETQGGADVTSRMFELYPMAAVVWTLQTNIIELSSR